MVNDILTAVSIVTDTPVDEIKSNWRKKGLPDARGLFFLVSSMAGFNAYESSAVVNKSFSSAFQSARKMKQRCIKDKELCKMRDSIIEMVGKNTGGNEIDLDPLWNENFCILDISSHHLGKCFVGMIDGSPMIHSEYFYAVVNSMLDYKRRKNESS